MPGKRKAGGNALRPNKIEQDAHAAPRQGPLIDAGAGGCTDWQEGWFMDIPITDASFSKNTAYDGAEFVYARRPSLLTQIIVTAAMAIVTILTPAAGAGAGGATTGLPVVASLA